MHPLEVDIAALEQAIATGACLIDVRNADEYEEVRVPGAILLPLGELVERQDEVPSVEPVYIVCHSGGRSLKATEYLRTLGVDAWSVGGGTKAWAESGRPTESGTQQQ